MITTEKITEIVKSQLPWTELMSIINILEPGRTHLKFDFVNKRPGGQNIGLNPISFYP